MIPTGIQRLDLMLDGGLPKGRSLLMFGPVFSGKDLLAREFLRNLLHRGQAAVWALTHDTYEDASAGEDLLASGRLRVVDAYSATIDTDAPREHLVCTDGPNDLNGLAVAIQKAQAELVRAGHDNQVLIIDNISTLAAYNNVQTTFRFLQVMIGKARRGGATIVGLLDDGMHSPEEVQMFCHLMDSMMEFRQTDDKSQIRVQGMRLSNDPGWIRYEIDKEGFQLVGGLSEGRIR